MNCIAYRDPRGELFSMLKPETNRFLDSTMTPSTPFAKLISISSKEKKRQKWWPNRYVIVCPEREKCVKYNLVLWYKFLKCTPL